MSICIGKYAFQKLRKRLGDKKISLQYDKKDHWTIRLYLSSSKEETAQRWKEIKPDKDMTRKQ